MQQTIFEIPGTRHEFQVIRLWEVATAELFQFPGLLPLAVLSHAEDKIQTLQQIAQQIETLPDQGAKSNVAAATSILAGLLLEKAVIRQVLREEIVKDSVIYQDILQQGLQQGAQAGEATLVLRLLKHCFAMVDTAILYGI